MRDRITRTGAWVAGLFVVLLASCGDPRQDTTADGEWSETELATLATLKCDAACPPASPGNALVHDPAAAELGQALFFETGFSPGGIGCATCHVPGFYFADHRELSQGIGQPDRHTPSVIGSQAGPFFFWDGRVDSLWAQALQPFENPVEMGTTRLGVVHLVGAKYAREYEALFGPLPELTDHERFPATGMPTPGFPDDPRGRAWSTMSRDDREAINQAFANVGKVIEAYEELLLPEPAPFDRYVEALLAGDLAGGGFLSPAAVRGLEAFIGSAGCVHCHNGPLFTDHGFHNIGLEPTGLADLDTSERQTQLARLDRGRSDGAWKVLASPFRADGPYGDADANPELEFLAPGFADFEGAFKTPSLRNVAMTAPYGHAGQFATLTDVIEWYRELPRVPMIGHRDLVLGLFDQDVDTTDLVAFLESLTGPLPPQALLGPPQ
jgi:cytochrome c peroxidase